jgi:hypothetical protein
VRTAVAAELSERIRPVAFASERVVPVLEPLAALFVGGGLARGAVVRVAGAGATSLALGLAAAATRQGAWAGCAGLPGIGLQAAGELGVALERLVVVPELALASWATVVAALLDGMEVVIVAPPAGARPGDGRRLAVRARERGSVLVVAGPRADGFEAGVVLRVGAGGWSGPAGGAGRLEQRAVEALGRGAAARPRRARLLLPGPGGAVEVAPAAPVGLAPVGLAPVGLAPVAPAGLVSDGRVGP